MWNFFRFSLYFLLNKHIYIIEITLWSEFMYHFENKLLFKNVFKWVECRFSLWNYHYTHNAVVSYFRSYSHVEEKIFSWLTCKIWLRDSDCYWLDFLKICVCDLTYLWSFIHEWGKDGTRDQWTFRFSVTMEKSAETSLLSCSLSASSPN